MINSFMFTAGQTSTSFTASSKGRVNNVCSKTDSFTYYHNGGGITPNVGDNVYTDSAGSLPLPSGSYRTNTGLSYFTITHLQSGEVTGIGNCAV